MQFQHYVSLAQACIQETTSKARSVDGVSQHKLYDLNQTQIASLSNMERKRMNGKRYIKVSTQYKSCMQPINLMWPNAVCQALKNAGLGKHGNPVVFELTTSAQLYCQQQQKQQQQSPSSSSSSSSSSSRSGRSGYMKSISAPPHLGDAASSFTFTPLNDLYQQQ